MLVNVRSERQNLEISKEKLLNNLKLTPIWVIMDPKQPVRNLLIKRDSLAKE